MHKKNNWQNLALVISWVLVKRNKLLLFFRCDSFTVTDTLVTLKYSHTLRTVTGVDGLVQH